jgi:hypothetical protein
VKEERDRVRHWLDQRERTGNSNAAGQKIGDSERYGEVKDRETGSLRKAHSHGNPHDVLQVRFGLKLRSALGPVQLIVPIASIGPA